MLQEQIGQARTVARGINKAERRGAAALEDSVNLMSQLIQARRGLNLPPTSSAGAMARAAAATNLIAQAMAELAACHEQLAVQQAELGLGFVAFGDECPLTLQAGMPETAADAGARRGGHEPPLRIVA